MNKRDWELALEVFQVYHPRVSAKVQNDRLFLAALHYFTVHDIELRALPEHFGNWNSIWKRFGRFRKSAVFEDYFSILAGLDEGNHIIQMFDSTVVRADVSAAGAKWGQEGQALGRSRGGFGTKIHLKTDCKGQPLGFELTGGEASDSPQLKQ